MTRNESLQDRIIRVLLGLTVTIAALVMMFLAPMETATGIVNLSFLIFGIEVLGTGLVGWSPLYALFGFSTNGRVGA